MTNIRSAIVLVVVLLLNYVVDAQDNTSKINARLGTDYAYIMEQAKVDVDILGQCNVYYLPATKTLNLRMDQILEYSGDYYPVFSNFSAIFKINPEKIQEHVNRLLNHFPAPLEFTRAVRLLAFFMSASLVDDQTLAHFDSRFRELRWDRNYKEYYEEQSILLRALLTPQVTRSPLAPSNDILFSDNMFPNVLYRGSLAYDGGRFTKLSLKSLYRSEAKPTGPPVEGYVLSDLIQ